MTVQPDVLDSPLWYRVAELRPRLRAHVQVQRREARGQVWMLLVDPHTGRFHRVDRAAWEFVGRINGHDTVQQLWQHAHGLLGEAAPSQPEVLEMLAQLAEAELIAADALPELAAFLGRKRQKRRQQRIAAANPLAFKLRLFNPTPVLDALQPLARALFSPAGLLLWLAFLLLAGATALLHGDALTQAFARQGLSRELLLTMWLAFPVVKGLHEFGHAMAVRAYGGSVKEMGLTLLMLTPVPYVDASAATQFPQRRRRIVVSAAGIAVELAIAGVALFAWLGSSHPVLQQAALAVMTLCGLSTLLFNGNPLARFDGYFMLSDALDLPNLAQRANAQALQWLQRALGLPAHRTVADHAREALWLGAYAVAATVYRLAVGALLIVWLQADWPLLALAIALLMGWSLLLRPAWRAFAFLLWDARLATRRGGALLRAGAGLALVLGLVGAAPAPLVTVAQGVVWLPERALLRAGTDGTLLTLHRGAGSRVQAGELVATLDNLELRGEREAAQALAVKLDVAHFQALMDDPARAARTAAERDAALARRERLDERLATLEVRAQADGVLALPRANDNPGLLLPRGRELGYVLTGEAPLVKLALSEAQAALLRAGTHGVSVRLADAPERVFEGRIERDTPRSTKDLPSAALGSAAGGPVPSDPADPQGRTALAPVVVVDVRLPGAPPAAIGQRAWVRLQHDGEPLIAQWGRGLRQLFLRSLGARD